MLNALKSKLIRQIITGVLQLAGSMCPDFVECICYELHLTKRQKEIIVLRYIKKSSFKNIPYLLSRRCEERQMFKEHKEVIDKLYVLVNKRKSTTLQ